MTREGVLKRRFQALVRVWLGVALGISSVLLRGQDGITQEGPWTVFRTGGGETLLSTNFVFEVPPLSAVPTLRFDFGFATTEPDSPGTFYDAFSVTLETLDRSASALLLTVDRTGVQWAPAYPGGLTLDPAAVQHADSAFANLSPTLELTNAYAYSVTLELPAALTGQSATLFLDLFDNANTYASLAYVGYARIETPAAGPRLHSTGTATGPYIEVPGAIHDATRRVFSTDAPAGVGFYRVFADRPTRITRIQAAGEKLEIEYAFVEVRLYSAAVAGGAYTEESGAVLDASGQTFAVARPAGPRFYRVLADRAVRIVEIRVEADRLILRYAYPLLKLHSAVAVGGPYAEETAATLDQLRQTFSLSEPPGIRFYRIYSDGPVRINRLQVVNGQPSVTYELLP